VLPKRDLAARQFPPAVRARQGRVVPAHQQYLVATPHPADDYQHLPLRLARVSHPLRLSLI
jgi:hypothetical protein